MYRPHFLSHYLTVGYWHQAQLHTEQCKQSLQHKLDVPSIGLLSGAQRNLILSHFHQVETCTSKNGHIISHQPSNSLWDFILWWQWVLGLQACTVSIHVLWLIGNKISKKSAAWLFKVRILLPWKWKHQVLPKCWYLSTCLQGVTCQKTPSSYFPPSGC